MKFEVLARCPTTRARVSRMSLAHGETALPTFMPVATQAAIKGLTPEQVESLGVTLILNNTYHLNLRPGVDILTAAGGAHKFEGWKRNMLTDSGGFQLVSLSKFTTITEEGALFASPFNGEPTMLTPEESMNIQHSIGADIIMQLDDVVPSLLRVPAWKKLWKDQLDGRSAAPPLSASIYTPPDMQNLFAIVQGGLDPILRDRCLNGMLERQHQVAGYAIGGLSGGEEKDIFWTIIKQCADKLPEDRPRYAMGIGFAEDLLVCVALGVDMADCVFPTRTARFGVALTHTGPINLRLGKHATDFNAIDDTCPCPTCKSSTSRAFLHHIVTHETTAAHSLTIHNIVFQAQVMGRARDAIIAGQFPAYLRSFFAGYFGDRGYPKWCVDALRSVGVDLLQDAHVPVVHGSGAKWEYSDAA
ncbi:hypothetical protein D9757_000613 [Collybiopsis confluens]|uniref:Queuine tRNA-ribosyltransferase catalytic subunit 1 n=1 Tax=Collybiopsis confluens TaxID=2823264 RepID=A0A8H5MGD6_9AGAR|nr:hypothetical protein D9757_000613 [Collybiopsis confluens]